VLPTAELLALQTVIRPLFAYHRGAPGPDVDQPEISPRATVE
jgi:hypothetical protein